MKKIAFVMGFISILGINAQALDLGSVVDKVIDDVWDMFDKNTNQIASVCYTPTDTSLSFDVCSLLDKLGNLEGDVCSLAPDIPGFKKKSRDISLSGLKSLCNAKVKEFSNVVSTTAVNTAENIIDEDKLSEKTELPNGMKVKDYLKRWNINSVLKDTSGSNLARTYFMAKDQQLLRLLMDYDKSSNNKGGKDISEIPIEDIRASKDLETYKEDRQELAKAIYNNRKETSATSISGSVSLEISGKQGENAQSSARDFLATKKNQINNAKANEIGQALQIYANKNDSIAIPTQETVELLRVDLRPKLVAQIRKQQIEEAQIIADITEKWDRREAIAELIVDKEVIMNEKFDEETAKREIEDVISSALSSAVDGIVDSAKDGVKNLIP